MAGGWYRGKLSVMEALSPVALRNGAWLNVTHNDRVGANLGVRANFYPAENLRSSANVDVARDFWKPGSAGATVTDGRLL
ncbi:hypothetical protein SAMN05443248_4982 [Bradyrhizobium erythrophlei]|uniref:Uncharacterized protein n=1 Tax=Bradyrhizobium erythrophlei TaxID=1437360 RepID=A0A1M5TEQ2_9BRAD|nr:hypothetical protein SAMN05443248_4982 [Bradyrhizobium erythrophlei]